MGTEGPPIAVKKATLTSKASIHQKFGSNACYKVEEIQGSAQNGCPGLAILQKGVPCLYRCCLQLPGLSVVSETFKRKKDAEQSAAEKALEELGIYVTENNPTVEEAWDDLVARLSYLFSNEFLSSLHPLSGHIRAALRRTGDLSGWVPVSVIGIYDSKLCNLCKYINPEVDLNPFLVMPLVLKAAARLPGFVFTSEDKLLMQRQDPYPPEIMQSLVNQQPGLPESIQIEAIRIPFSVEKNIVPLTLNVSVNGYYLDAIGQELDVTDTAEVMVSRTIGKASSEMRLYFCARKLCSLDLSSELHVQEAAHFTGSLNTRASYFSGQEVYGDAILASVGYTWRSSDLFHEHVTLRTYYRLLVNKIPGGVYKLSREAILVAELPVAFTTRSNWRGPFPKEILFTFCRQHRLSEPVFSILSNSSESSLEFPGSHKRLKVTESDKIFRFEVKIFSKQQDLIIQCSPKESYKKQTDAIQNAALKVLSWLNIYFKNLDISLEKLTSSGNQLDIQFYPQHFFKEFVMCPSVYTSWQSRLLDSNCMNQLNGMEDRVSSNNKGGPTSGFTPSSGSLVCISYSISLVTEEYLKELIESSEEFEFEMGTGAVIPCLEAVVTQMSVGQSTYLDIGLPPHEFILAVAADSARTLSLLSSRDCRLEYTITLLQVTEPLEDRMEQALFSPPLSKQRVEYALQQIKESCATSLVDFGCGSGSLLDSLSEYRTSLEKIVGVDISQKGLTRAAKILNSKLSIDADTMVPSNGIKSVLLYEGSITIFDSRLYGFDIGTCLEVIEHMEEDQAFLFGDIVLSSFCPRILIVSTPNYEYNVILQKSSLHTQEEDPDEKNQPQSTKFRNHDHKFEWTREQFNCWASELATRHNYSVEFSGVGGAADVGPGFASQIAVFRRRDNLLMNVDSVHCYEVLWEWSSANRSRSVL